jgi:hypothetical protein
MTGNNRDVIKIFINNINNCKDEISKKALIVRAIKYFSSSSIIINDIDFRNKMYDLFGKALNEAAPECVNYYHMIRLLK